MNDRAAQSQFIETSAYLLVAMELAKTTWRLELAGGLGGKRSQGTVSAWDREGFVRLLDRARQRFGLPRDSRVVVCQEAGPDGFSVHRYLVSIGAESLVIDGASCSVDRRQRRAKTDRLDASMLMNHLERHLVGQPRVWRVIRVPSEQAEDRRHLNRELDTVRTDRTRIRNRIRSLLMIQGIGVPVNARLLDGLPTLQTWSGEPLRPQLRERLERECQHLVAVEARMVEIKARRKRLIETSEETDIGKVRHLQNLRAIGDETSWRLVTECFGWRHFQNRRQVGACGGLTPTPYNSGKSVREQGISKDGNSRLRALLIETAWGWLRWQPQSELSLWFESRFGKAGKRSRKVGIVALARKLFIALWRYVEYGIVPQGAVLKA